MTGPSPNFSLSVTLDEFSTALCLRAASCNTKQNLLRCLIKPNRQALGDVIRRRVRVVATLPNALFHVQ